MIVRYCIVYRYRRTIWELMFWRLHCQEDGYLYPICLTALITRSKITLHSIPRTPILLNVKHARDRWYRHFTNMNALDKISMDKPHG